MTFAQKKVGLLGFFRLVLVCGFLAGLFLFVFFNPAYSKAYYVLVAVVGLYITVFYVLTHKTEPAVMPPQLNAFPSITVLIPCHNGAPTLRGCLQSVLAMNYPRRFRVLVVDDASTDDSVKIASQFSRVTVISHSQNIGKAKGLNHALKRVKTELVVCIDCDTYPNPNVLLDCVPLFFAKKNVGAVAPFITVANAKTWVQRMQEIEYFSGFGFYSKVAAQLDGLYVAPGPLTVFSRKALEEIKGFDEDNLTEDMEIALRLHGNGFGLAYSPSQVPTEVPDTLRGLYRQRVRWYRGTIFNIVKYKRFFFNPRFKAFGRFFFPALTAFVTLILLSFVVIWSLLLYWLIQGFWNLYWSLSTGQWPLLSRWFENLTVSSLGVFLVIALLAWYVFFVQSIGMLNLAQSRRMVFPALLTVFFYPLLISFVYTLSLLKELKASKRAW